MPTVLTSVVCSYEYGIVPSCAHAVFCSVVLEAPDVLEALAQSCNAQPKRELAIAFVLAPLSPALRWHSLTQTHVVRMLVSVQCIKIDSSTSTSSGLCRARTQAVHSLDKKRPHYDQVGVHLKSKSNI
jgi:hypothetical protein